MTTRIPVSVDVRPERLPDGRVQTQTETTKSVALGDQNGDRMEVQVNAQMAKWLRSQHECTCECCNKTKKKMS